MAGGRWWSRLQPSWCWRPSGWHWSSCSRVSHTHLKKIAKTKQKIPGLVLNDAALVACPAASCEKTASCFKCKHHYLLPACKKLAGSLEQEEKEAEQEVQQHVHWCVKVPGRRPKLQSPTECTKKQQKNMDLLIYPYFQLCSRFVSHCLVLRAAW